MKVNGITWVVIRAGYVAMERCEKKARVLGVGTWFIPGGKIEGNESASAALRREFSEEWPTVDYVCARELPLLEGSAVPPGPRGLFMMRPFVVDLVGELPPASSEGTPLLWIPVAEALKSPVVQVRMMVAGGLLVSGR